MNIFEPTSTKQQGETLALRNTGCWLMGFEPVSDKLSFSYKLANYPSMNIFRMHLRIILDELYKNQFRVLKK